MKKILIILFIFLFGSLAYPEIARAQVAPQECAFKVTCVANCKLGNNKNEIFWTDNTLQNTPEVEFSFDLSTIPQNVWDEFPDKNGDRIPDFFDDKLYTHPDSSAKCNNVTQNLKTTNIKSVIKDVRGLGDSMPGVCSLYSLDAHTYHLKYKDNAGKWNDLCAGSYTVGAQVSADITITSENGKQDVDSIWKVEVKNVVVQKPRFVWLGYTTLLDGNYLNNNLTSNYIEDKGTLSNPFDHSDVWFKLKPLTAGTHTIAIKTYGHGPTNPDFIIATQEFTVLKRGEPTPTLTIAPSLTPTLAPGAPSYTPMPPVPPLKPLCDQIDPQFSNACHACVDNGKIWTAIGCLPTDFSDIINNYVFKLGIGIAGGISFLYFVYGVFLILTSAGNAEKITQAKEIIVSAISGLLLIIFSVFLLKVIGVDILKIPGFGG